jgi:glutamate racemase
MAKVAPWPVTWIDPAPAIARRTADVVEETRINGATDAPPSGTVILTSARGSASETLAAYGAMGFPHHLLVDLPV